MTYNGIGCHSSVFTVKLKMSGRCHGQKSESGWGVLYLDVDFNRNIILENIRNTRSLLLWE